MNKRAVLAFGVMLAAVLAGCGGGGTSLSTTTSAPSTTSAATSTTVKPQSVDVAVVVCPTTVAISVQPPAVALPTSVTVALAQSMAAQTVVYVDKGNRTRLLGPKGWTCVAAYGADGSGGIDLYAPGESPAPSFSPVPTPDEAITVAETGGSPVQAAAQACPYFASAAATMQSDLGHGCTTPPGAERVTKVSSRVVAFEDPPGTKGGGVPSGGPYLADGAISYTPASQPGTYIGTCALPASGQRICAFMLNYFEALYGGSKPGTPDQSP